MNCHIYTLRLIAMMAGLSSSAVCKAQVDTNWMQTNSQWHLVPGSFSTAPFGFVPTNARVRFFPLENGQWVWTTNREEYWTQSKVDLVKLHQVRLQELQRIDDTDPPGIAHVLEYNSRGLDPKHHWSTNMAVNWWGVWVDDTNTGWRVNLCPVKSHAVDEGAIIKVGSIVTNSGAGYLPTADGKYAKLELLDANGKIIPTKPGAALRLYEYGGTNVARSHPMPSLQDASVEEDYPATISDTEYPRWKNGDGLQAGRFMKFAGFVSDGPPCHIGYVKFNDIFSIKAEGDYTLTVQPVLYRMHHDGGTFQGYLDRVDLPSVTTKVHLIPNGKK